MMTITLCMNPKKAVKQARLTPLCRTSVFIQGQKHLMRKGTVFLIPLTQITLDTRSLIRMWTWMTTEITNNANDVYKHLPFCRQAVFWDQSWFLFCSRRGGGLYHLQETIVLDLAVTCWTGLSQSYFILCNCSDGTKVNSYLKHSWANWRSRGQRDHLIYVFALTEKQIPQLGGRSIQVAEHL